MNEKIKIYGKWMYDNIYLLKNQLIYSENLPKIFKNYVGLM